MSVDPNKDSWLSKNVRPLVMLIAFVTLSLVIILRIMAPDWLIRMYAGWTGVMITFYFGIREYIKYIQRKK